MHGLWLAFLALIVCGLEFAVADSVRFNLTLLIVPLAAWAGWRHRWRGFEIVALGAAPLLVGISIQVVRSPSNLGLYVVALSVAALAAVDRPLPTLLRPLRVSPALLGAIVLLPLSMFIGDRLLDSGVTLYSHLTFSPLLYFALFVFGFSRGRSAVLFALLALATVAGIAMRLGVARDVLPFSYVFSQPASFLTAVALFHTARNLAAVQQEAPVRTAFTRYRWTLLLLIALLYGGAPLYERLVAALGMDRSVAWALSPVGNYYALPAFGLMAGMVARFRGAAIATVVVAGLELLRPVLHYSSADAAAPMVAFAFAVLGTHLFDHARNRETVWYPQRWITYLGLGSLAAALLLPGEGANNIFVTALFIALLVALALALRWLRRLIGPPGEGVVAGWIALAGTLLLAIGMLQHGRQSIALLATVPALFGTFGGRIDWGGVEPGLMGIVVAFYLTVLLAALVELLRRLPALQADFARLRHWYGVARASGTWRVAIPPISSAAAAHATRPGPRLNTAVRVLRWARNAIAVVTVAGLLLNILGLG